MNTIKEISERIEEILEIVDRTEYFTVFSISGEEIKIRVGNHSANRQNNGDLKTLSFVSTRTTQKRSAYNAMVKEWEVDFDSKLTDTYQTIEQILDWEDISNDQKKGREMNYAKI